MRAYADLRAYADVGGRREGLVAPGTKLATTDRAVAEALLAARVRTLEAKRRGRALGLELPETALGPFVRDHLIAKRRSGRITEQWLAQSEHLLESACQFFGYDRDLASIEVADIERWLEHLRHQETKRGKARSTGSLLHYLNVLSNVFRRAQKLKVVPLGHNPVWALMDKPALQRAEARWLEVHEAALVLEAAKHYRSSNPSKARHSSIRWWRPSSSPADGKTKSSGSKSRT